MKNKKVRLEVNINKGKHWTTSWEQDFSVPSLLSPSAIKNNIQNWNKKY